MTEPPSPIQLAQLARLLGAEELHAAIARQAQGKGIDVSRLRALLEERLERLARGLLEEAVASDDVVDGASAEAYLEDRLAFFGELLSEEQRRRVRELYLEAVRQWGRPGPPLT
jgi:GTP cyclohydrolase FolE2